MSKNYGMELVIFNEISNVISIEIYASILQAIITQINQFHAW